MKLKVVRRDASGVSGVIEALLLVGLVAIVISTIQLVYIPQIMSQREADHMDEVSNQFSYMKAMIDIQTQTKSNAPISSIVTLGSRELPYFISVGASGELSIQTSNLGNIVVGAGSPLMYLTTIKYEAFNSYFVDQTYIFEGGGIIVAQPDGTSVMRVDPSIQAFDTGSRINLYFNLTNIVGIPGKNSTIGNGKCLIRTNFYSHVQNPKVTYTGEPSPQDIFIYTKYPHAWNESLNRTIGMYVDVNMHASEASPYVEIMPNPGKPIHLEIRETFIEAQVGPGWVL